MNNVARLKRPESKGIRLPCAQITSTFVPPARRASRGNRRAIFIHRTVTGRLGAQQFRGAPQAREQLSLSLSLSTSAAHSGLEHCFR